MEFRKWFNYQASVKYKIVGPLAWIFVECIFIYKLHTYTIKKPKFVHITICLSCHCFKRMKAIGVFETVLVMKFTDFNRSSDS